MNRFKLISAVFKYLFLVASVLSACRAAQTFFDLCQMTPDIHIVGEFWFTPRGQTLLFFGEFVGGAVFFWFCYKFFGMCSRNESFTPRNVRYLQAAGCAYFLFFPVDTFRLKLSEIYLNAFNHFGSGVTIYLPLSWSIFPAVIVSLFPGVFIIFIAWIMDEGRKIREEQELTV